ncbi:MAG: hypothetical protein KatS3mg108_0967 [Isosphaeraceae bacterium]|nr:MAG: hypothetical protein KatS3mg108_0967 [Isosphaeraceae bacterium]
MKAIFSLFVAAIVLSLLGETSGQGLMAPAPIQYTVTGETCRTVGSGQPLNCKSCSSTIYPDPKCASGERCFAIDCTQGATEFDGCTSRRGRRQLPLERRDGRDEELRRLHRLFWQLCGP